MRLCLPDIRQQDDFSCGAASLAALLAFHGIPRPRWLCRLANPDRGMTPETVEAVLFAATGRPPLRGSMGVADLRHLTRSGRPVMAVCDLGHGSHWVVVSGVVRRRVYYHDPTHGPSDLREADWLTVWRDTPATSPYQRFGICPHHVL